MAITINGNGTLTGISAGGLPSVATDLSNDTTPQLGGTLDCNNQNVQFKSGGATKIQYATGNNSLEFVDDAQARFGSGDDLKIYHDGTHSYIQESGTGALKLSGDDIRLVNVAGNNIIKANGDVAELFHSGSKKFETTSDGVLIGDSALCKFGTDSDAYISHTGSDFNIVNSTGVLAIGNNSGTGVGEGSVVFKSGNNNARWTLESGGNFVPASNNAFAIGSSSNRVSVIYSNAALNTSDKTLKNTITTSDLGLDFINKLKPVSYKWNQYEGEISDTRTHYGLIAQDVEEVITSSGKTLNDFGGVDKPDEGCMGLAYSQFVSPLIKAVQELSAEVKTLKTKVAALEVA